MPIAGGSRNARYPLKIVDLGWSAGPYPVSFRGRRRTPRLRMAAPRLSMMNLSGPLRSAKTAIGGSETGIKYRLRQESALVESTSLTP